MVVEGMSLLRRRRMELSPADEWLAQQIGDLQRDLTQVYGMLSQTNSALERIACLVKEMNER